MTIYVLMTDRETGAYTAFTEDAEQVAAGVSAEAAVGNLVMTSPNLGIDVINVDEKSEEKR